jgi:beta-glucosidase
MPYRILILAVACVCRPYEADPLTPIPRPIRTARYAGLLDAARARQPGVLFLGDSIAARWLTTGRPVWDRAFAPLGAASLGVGEDRTEHLLWRLESGELAGIDPGAVVLMIGTNNLSRCEPGAIAAAIERIAARCRAIWPAAPIVVMGILPRSDRGSVRLNAAGRLVNARLAGLDDGSRVRFLDLAGDLATPDHEGRLRPEMGTDGLHLSVDGYRVWARALAGFLSRKAKEGEQP